MYLNYCLSF